MTVPSTLEYGSISVPIFPESGQQGILHTSDRTRQVNQHDFSRFQKPLVKGLIAFSAVNLAIGGSVIGFFASYSKSQEAIFGSTPFIANSLIGIFGLVLIKSFQGIARENRDSLSL